uniref:Cartilage oligomeric matrix protein n=1 Tax=Dendroctonus ponderosae TaxID=77166 RepID=A0AAR5P3M5_DENPD
MAGRIFSIALLLLLASVLLTDAVSLDLDTTKELESVIKNDNFILSLKHIKPKKRSRGLVETLVSIDFPGAENKFSLLLDRKTKRVVVQTLEDSRQREQHFTVDVLHDDSLIKSLILAINQSQPAHANLYLNCVAYGMVATPKSMREMYSGMRWPNLEVFHERKYQMEVDGYRDIRAVLSRNECPLPIEKTFDAGFSSDLSSNSLKDDPNIQSQEPYRSVVSSPTRGDIPLVTTLDDFGLINAMNQLINVVNLEVEKCKGQAEAFDKLRRLIEECELCRQRPVAPQVPTCATHPPGCAPGVRCHETPQGPRCGECPSGYIGDGYSCTPGKSCADRPCYPGVECRDTARGYQCGPCPGGFEGNGENCRRRNPCEYNPCAPGVSCSPISEDPYYQCSQCPEGFTGNGENCHDIDECDLVHPCDPNVECTNLSPGYQCGSCPSGYTETHRSQGTGIYFAERNRQVCTDIDECASGSVCVENSRCINTLGSYECGSCDYGFVGNQSIGCRQGEGYCPNNLRCDRNAKCGQLVSGEYICVCIVGWAGNGEICGRDSDLDSWPDDQLPCGEEHCRKDNCLDLPNSGQEDADGDGLGNACDPDPDGDNVISDDNCPFRPNADQRDSERNPDKIGDVCDNCVNVYNPDQSDIDNDDIGDACDPDMDNDGILNERDNCPRHANRNQLDSDGDGLGDVCDNCPSRYNPEQEDVNENLVGDVCETRNDIDRDGVNDERDNCVSAPNPSQMDTDYDGLGDECDKDLDGDGIANNVDNCIYIYNPDQADSDSDGIGNICTNNLDGDLIVDYVDNCPNNSLIYRTDFRKFQTVILDPIGESQKDPYWLVYNNGSEIYQSLNSDPGLAIGYDQLIGVDFEGTFFVDTEVDDDYVGFVFSYQNNKKFYTVMWKKNHQTYWQSTPFRAVAEPGIQIKLVDSETGPGTHLRNALWHTGDTPKQVKLLWVDANNVGWKEKTAYRWFLIHRPLIGLIRFKIFEGEQMIADSGNIFDSTLAGGRLGVLCFSQEKIIWSDLVYRCNDNLREEIYNELPHSLRGRVHIDNTIYQHVQQQQ